MEDLRIGHGLHDQVAARHHAAALELGGLDSLPDLGSGPGTLAMLRMFTAVLAASDDLARASDLTAAAVDTVARTVRATDLEVGLAFRAGSDAVRP